MSFFSYRVIPISLPRLQIQGVSTRWFFIFLFLKVDFIFYFCHSILGLFGNWALYYFLIFPYIFLPHSHNQWGLVGSPGFTTIFFLSPFYYLSFFLFHHFTLGFLEMEIHDFVFQFSFYRVVIPILTLSNFFRNSQSNFKNIWKQENPKNIFLHWLDKFFSSFNCIG